MRIGIFLGGNSREREISFAGGRTVFDNLDKRLFTPVPIFIDSFNNFILLPWQLLYKGSIRDFYPNAEAVSLTGTAYQIYAESIAYNDKQHQLALAKAIGTVISAEELNNYIDFAFLALHGENGEDGRLQGLLEWLQIPYSGSGILPSAVGMNKRIQREWLSIAGFACPKWISIKREEWINKTTSADFFKKTIQNVGAHFVVKSANQGSSIGLQLLKKADIQDFELAIDKCFFLHRITPFKWHAMHLSQKQAFLKDIVDIRIGIGLPLTIGNTLLHNPEAVWEYLEALPKTDYTPILMVSIFGESEVLIESFIDGKEFSCIVVEDLDGKPLALPPTGIHKKSDFFDYRAKYLPGLSRKVTPMDVPQETLHSIREKAVALFKLLNFNVYARIDGFLGNDGLIYLNDPNTTSGMLPASFFFHQAAEIGLNPSQFLTYIIETSIKARMRDGMRSPQIQTLYEKIVSALKLDNESENSQKTIGVLMGGYSSEKHISVESGRNVVEKLASSTNYKPIPLFLAGNEKNWALYKLPTALLLKDNADDIAQQIKHFIEHPALAQIRQQANSITKRFNKTAFFEPLLVPFETLSSQIDFAFIALHGRPGEDGSLQKMLQKQGIPFNGSLPSSSAITINKYETNQILRQNGMLVADHLIIDKNQYLEQPISSVEKAVSKLGFPLIAKPIDDGCSSAVKKIDNQEQLHAYAKGVFRENEHTPLPTETITTLGLYPDEVFPAKSSFLLETFISKGDAKHFLEVTGGMLTKIAENGSITYEFFEPSESLAISEVLSLEEKFLAGEGLNITPARFADDPEKRVQISAIVKDELAKAAKILGVIGYCRIDAFVKIFDSSPPQVYIIEINSLPGMTPATCIFHQSALAGYTPLGFIDAIIQFGFKINAHVQ